MLACLSVTLCVKGATVRISRRVWLTGTGAIAASMIAAACLAAPASGGIQPPPGGSIAALSAAPAAASAAAPPALSGPMVALGDSYTAGALLPIDLRARPLGCLRSAKGYPVLVAAALGAPLADVACASAGGTDMTPPQGTN